MKKTATEKDMASRATVTFHTTPETKERLDRLAIVTRRSKSFLTNEAVQQYLAAEEEFVTVVQEGIADADAGRVFTSAEVKASVHQHIEKIGQAQKTT
jgi:predicted transcriptional regulator